MLNFFKNISPTEWAIIALILIVFLGRSTVIKLGKTSGETLREIKNIKKNFTEAIENEPRKDKKEVAS
jgi:Sec-independent protein translocase protein TatA